MYNPVVGSTVHDRVHKGGRQAGFKSHMSYNTEKGIPGYTGYTPGTLSLVIPTKGATIHTGKAVHPDVQKKNLLAQNDTHKHSESRAQHETHESNFKPHTKTGGGYWLYDREAVEGKPFTATSTYRAEITDAQPDKDKDTTRVLGVPHTLAYQEQGRRSSSAPGADMRASRRGLRTMPLGYQSEYGAMIAENPLTGGTAAPGGPRHARGTPEHRNAVALRAALPRLVAHQVGSTYAQDFGAYGADPLDRTADRATGVTAAATTTDLASGTTRVTPHIPGYTGHLPASEHDVEGSRQAAAGRLRPDAKVGQLLFTNDNYSRTRLPGTRTFKPQAHCNVTAVQPAQGPTLDTTQGWTNHQLTNIPLKAVQNENFIGRGNNGLMAFYTGGGVSVSDDGVANAQTFYMKLRPLEGLAKHARASKTTTYGARFPHAEF